MHVIAFNDCEFTPWSQKGFGGLILHGVSSSRCFWPQLKPQAFFVRLGVRISPFEAAASITKLVTRLYKDQILLSTTKVDVFAPHLDHNFDGEAILCWYTDLPVPDGATGYMTVQCEAETSEGKEPLSIAGTCSLYHSLQDDQIAAPLLEQSRTTKAVLMSGFTSLNMEQDPLLRMCFHHGYSPVLYFKGNVSFHWQFSLWLSSADTFQDLEAVEVLVTRGDTLIQSLSLARDGLNSVSSLNDGMVILETCPLSFEEPQPGFYTFTLNLKLASGADPILVEGSSSTYFISGVRPTKWRPLSVIRLNRWWRFFRRDGREFVFVISSMTKQRIQNRFSKK